MSDSTYEGIVDYSRFPVNQDLLKEIKVLQEQKEECLQVFTRHALRLRTLMTDGQKHQAANAVIKLEQLTNLILLTEQVGH